MIRGNLTGSHRERSSRGAWLPLWLACLVGVGVMSGCATDRPIETESDLAALGIPQDATRTATAASLEPAGATKLVTDAPVRFFRVNPGVDNWFEADETARVIGWSSSPGSEVRIDYVSRDGSRTVIDDSGSHLPLPPPDDPTVYSGGGAGRRTLRDDQQTLGPGWLVIVPRTYDNNSALVGIQLTSRWP